MITAESALNHVRDYAREPGVNQSDIIAMINKMIDTIQKIDTTYNVDVIVMNDFDELENISVNSGRIKLHTNRHLSMVRIFSNYKVNNVYVTQQAMDKNEDIQLILTKLKLDGKDYQLLG